MSLGGGLKLVLIGDGESPHLLKWARALQPRVQLHAISSRGFLPEFLQLLPDARRLALNTEPEHAGGNVALIKQLPKIGAWLADTESHTVRMIDARTGNLELIAGTGEKGNGGDGDPLKCAMNRLHGVFVDTDGSVFIGDSEAHRVRVLRKR